MTRYFFLDTDSDGNDETLQGETRDDVIADLCHHYEFSDLPSHWELTEIDEGDPRHPDHKE